MIIFQNLPHAFHCLPQTAQLSVVGRVVVVQQGRDRVVPTQFDLTALLDLGNRQSGKRTFPDFLDQLAAQTSIELHSAELFSLRVGVLGDLFQFALLHFHRILEHIGLLLGLLSEDLAEGLLPLGLHFLDLTGEVVDEFAEGGGEGLDLVEEGVELGMAFGFEGSGGGGSGGAGGGRALGEGGRVGGMGQGGKEVIVTHLADIGLLIAAFAEHTVLLLLPVLAGEGEDGLPPDCDGLIVAVELEAVKLGAGVGVAAFETGVEGVSARLLASVVNVFPVSADLASVHIWVI